VRSQGKLDALERIQVKSAVRGTPRRIWAMKKRRFGQSAVVNLRASIALLLCTTAAWLLVSKTGLAFFRSGAPVDGSRRTLTFAERLAYQRAIEDVYWRHRIWPKENPDPKPPLDAVISQAQLEKKVEQYLRNSQALEDYWQRPITAEQLQAEMDRMARDTKQPEVLRELFEALGNDPFIVAECVTRPVLSGRLITNRYVCDSRIRRELRQPAEADLRIRKNFVATNANYTLPTISEGAGCVDDTWTATSIINAPSGRGYHTALWTGSEMIVWGGTDPPFTYFNTGGIYNPATDSWTATSTTNAPEARAVHTAVWTGSEMVVWGGRDGTNPLNTGGRYNPATDTWTATSTTNAPTAVVAHTAIWTGTEMIVWGGVSSINEVNTGGRYNPNTDSWTATSITNAPTARDSHTAVWTGSEMIVWGGETNSGLLNTGGRYDPATDSWTATSTMNVPIERIFHTAVWSGSEMIVWGGSDGAFAYYNTGGRYNPTTDNWTATSTTNATQRSFHTAIWTGSEMIVWAGGTAPGGFSNTGERYNPGTDSWTPTSITNAPEERSQHTAVWTGTEMIVWGGTSDTTRLNTGGRYCAQSGATPTPTPTPTATATVTPTPTSTPRVTPSPRPRPTPHPRPSAAPRTSPAGIVNGTSE
jgi:N-acetylneuraminic acid mutarotase